MILHIEGAAVGSDVESGLREQFVLQSTFEAQSDQSDLCDY